MRKHLNRIIFMVAVGIPSISGAQSRLGEWSTHLPYKYCLLAEATDERVYCSATGGLFSYRQDDQSLEKLSKIDGLSDNGVAAMRWDRGSGTLILAYKNANLDIIRGNDIVNLPDIMMKQIPGDKKIYDIYYHGNNAYLSTGFGIVVVNLEKDEIRETYYIGEDGQALRVNQCCSDGTWLYAATEQGLKRGALDNPFLVDYNTWEKITDLPDPEGNYDGVACFNGALFTSWQDPAGEQDRLFYRPAGMWVDFPGFAANECLEILEQEDYLSIVDDSLVNLVSSDFLVIRQMATGDPQSASLDGEGNLWVADNGRGLVTDKGGGQWTIVPDGPVSNSVFAMATGGGILYTVLGGVTSAWNNQFNRALLEYYRDGEWGEWTNWQSRDLVALAVHPDKPGQVFAGSWGYGLHEYVDGKETAWYGEDNSSLQSINPGDYFIRIGGLAFDPMGNLWMTNSNVAEPISVRKADGTWQSFAAGNKLSEFTALGDIIVTRSGHKWGIVPKVNGLFAMDDNGTLDDTSDDIYEHVNIVDRYGKIITNDVRALAEDHNGNLWLGTGRGILVIYSPYRLFTEGEIYAQEIIVPRNDGSGKGDVLLKEQVVTDIEVDGANRKWLGTAGGGAYLVSDDGFDEVAWFNEVNSPLLSDNIIDITIDGTSGEVYFATDEGIISYRGDALQGNSFFDNVVVYPNPVRDTYEGPVAIKGLLENTSVKIQDMGGNLVFETTSLGGQAIWDGTNFRGDRVATGVYLVFLSSEYGELTHVTKLLFIH